MRRIKNTIYGAATCLALTVGAVAAFPGTAAAADTITVCRDAYQNHCGHAPTTVSDALKQVSPAAQDSISSIVNPTSTPICFYEHNNFQGRSFVHFGPGNINNLANVWVDGKPMNDVISSWRPHPHGGPGPCA
ncbi:hypothetical protein ACFUIT_20275 [Streptomyces sp. NPDC057239]|uniref:hypothetical protein n=1 Tax=Streptomyces sp. NPDC057239 TaxID=3346061 RepID=UPI00363AE2ED